MPHSLTRHKIIEAIRAKLEQNPSVLAMWLEGADANDTVDEYSDIDLSCSVEMGMLDEVTQEARNALSRLDNLDLDASHKASENRGHTVFHLEGSSRFLLIDFAVYVGIGSQFIKEDDLEKPAVLFDRRKVITYMGQDEALAKSQSSKRLEHLVDVVSQSSRIEKCTKRNNFLEAIGYYHRWLLTPLVEVLRMCHSPLHPDYHIVHISRHLPESVLSRLENLYKVDSVKEIEEKIRDAKSWFHETAVELQIIDSKNGK